MVRLRLTALLLAAPLILLGCGRGDPAGNNSAEAENRAVADLLDVGDNSFASADDEGAQPRNAASPQKAEAPPPKKAEAAPPQEAEAPPNEPARRAGERG